tara:strand:- start:11940 stop:13118 length:1179 start_codon:yes stop_codon:yes gene_type:complete
MSTKLKYISSIVGIQIFSALVSFFAALFLTNKFGLSFLGEFSFDMSIAFISFSLISLGIPELAQKKYSINHINELSISATFYHFFLATVIVLSLFFFFKYSYLDCFYLFMYMSIMVFVEKIARFLFQDGKAFFGQLFLSLPVILFWIMFLINTSSEISVFYFFFLSLILTVLIMLLLIPKRIFSLKLKRYNFFKGSWFVAFSLRLLAMIIDWFPVLFFGYYELYLLSGLYAITAKFFMPIVLISNGLVNFFLKETLDNRFTLRNVATNVLSYYFVLILFAFLFVLLFLLNPFNFLETFDLSLITIQSFLLALIYRISYLMYIYLSQISLKWITEFNVKSSLLIFVFVPLFVFAIIFLLVFYKYDFSDYLFITPLFMLTIFLLAFYLNNKITK